MKTTLAIVSAALCLLAPSCGGGDRTGTYEHDFGAALEGAVEDAPEGLKAMLAEAMKSMEGMRIQMTLNPDHTYSQVFQVPAGESRSRGTWELDGDTVTFVQTHMDGEEIANVLTGTFVGNSELHLTSPEGDLVMKKG